MHPFISLSSRIELDSWEVMMTVALLSGSLVALTVLKKETGWIMALFLLILLTWGALFGAHLAHISFHWDVYQQKYFQTLLIFWKDGHNFFGALAFCALLLFISSRILKRLDFWTAADAFALGTPLGLFFARIGCYMKGCCWGTPISQGHPFNGVSFKLLQNRYLALHPVQLYSAAAGIAIFFVLILVYRKQKAPGTVTGVFCFLYAVARLLLEFFRGDTSGHILLGPLSVHQGICLLILPASVAFLYFRLRNPQVFTSDILVDIVARRRKF